LQLALRHRPDIVLLGLVNFGSVAWAAARASGARLVQNIYGYEVWSSLTLARKQALYRSDGVISDCHNTADQALQLGLVKARPTVIWDCVDTERYDPPPPEGEAADLTRYGLHRSDKFRVLILCRLNKQTRYKGFVRLLHLQAQHLGDGFEVVVAGKGDDVAYLRGLASELGIRDSAVFTGPIDEQDMPAIYRSADAFYLPSEVGDEAGEGIPLTPLEAMACGAPAIVGDQDGSRETFEQGAPGGWCGDPLDLQAQAAYLRRLKDEPDFHQQERLEARRRAVDAFGYAAFARKTCQAVEGFLK
jgi:phosphatidyl-myo-inositol dimannoside synthase